MEPVKFEDHIKKQLEKREITPSAGSWEKLEARLEQGPETSGPKLWWVGIAAAIAGVFFFLGTLFNDPVEPAVVEQTSKEIIPHEAVEQPETEVSIASEKTEKQEVTIPDTLPEKEPILKIETAIAVQEKRVENAIFESEETEMIDVPGIEESVSEATPPPSAVSDAEVDALLNAAMADLERNRSLYALQPVDAEELLHQVEYELEQNFRQKVFEVLKEGFSKAKTAVANRNY